MVLSVSSDLCDFGMQEWFCGRCRFALRTNCADVITCQLLTIQCQQPCPISLPGQTVWHSGIAWVNEMTDAKTRPTKRCFVTVGATASFIALIRKVLEPSFLEALKAHGYTELRIQYGKDGKKTFDDYLWVLSDDLKNSTGIEITGFDFNINGLREEMLAAKRIYTNSTMDGLEGCVISHAGKSDGEIYMQRRLRSIDKHTHRFWINIGCYENRCTCYRCPQYGSSGQPPSRAGRGPRRAKLRRTRRFEVCIEASRLVGFED